jgi:nitrate/nitrite transport system permease protein
MKASTLSSVLSTNATEESPPAGASLSAAGRRPRVVATAKARGAYWKWIDAVLLPLAGIVGVIVLWYLLSATLSKDLPNPTRTWQASKPYVLEPFAKRGELDQGILRFTWLSLILVAKGYAIALLVGTPLGFLLGLSRAFTKMFDPIIQVLRPVSPLAWLPLGMVLFLGAGRNASELAALFTIAVCAMWPTVLNTAVGVRAIPVDYLNVARVLRLSRWKTLTQVMIPATLPYMFTGFRLSLGIAWLVIVAAEMLTGRPGVGGFLWQQYNALIYEQIILCIITIGVVGFILDRLMSVIERRFKTA